MDIENEAITIASLIEKHGLILRAIEVPMRTDREQSEWDKTANHWHCTIAKAYGNSKELGNKYSFYYSMGSALEPKKPTLEQTLASLAMDSYSADLDFDNWCAECGYDTDSRKAFEVYVECQAIRKQLQSIFKSDYDALLSVASEY